MPSLATGAGVVGTLVYPNFTSLFGTVFSFII
jgi:hypothetical protein